VVGRSDSGRGVLGWGFSFAQPTPAPDGAFPSREGIQADFLIHITLHPGGGASSYENPLRRRGWRAATRSRSAVVASGKQVVGSPCRKKGSATRPTNTGCFGAFPEILPPPILLIGNISITFAVFLSSKGR